mmetsp:Transcript_21708/g.67300  ORF Transcript_21708/g.67300 Transcript_21708/m.67300 type:complete len:206 (-) Transcript_21708:199-816(-)
MTGSELEPMPARPSWPDVPRPNANASPLLVRTSECACPAETPTTNTCLSASMRRGRRCERSSPQPSCPECPSPHAYTAPLSVTARQWSEAASVTTRPLTLTPAATPRCSTRTGASASSSERWPRAPCRPHPHASTSPSSSMARVCKRPAATSWQRKRAARSVSTARGDVTGSRSPVPSWPCAFSPNVKTAPVSSSSAPCRPPAET